jgi:primosomal protein N' (replication factor Y) (superfamily II helicase)
MDTLAQVIVNMHRDELDKTFTYRVPAGMQVAVGSRVIVPFARQRLEGYCVGLSAEPFGGEVKDIEEVLDSDPLLSEELLMLAEWGAARYLCRRLDFLQAMLPAGKRFKAEKWVEYCGATQAEGAMLIYLQENGPLLLSRWQKAFPAAAGMLRRLQRDGIIKLGSKDSYGLREKIVKAVAITAAGREASVTGKKQQVALALLRANCTMTAGELAQSGVSSATVNSLSGKGLVEVREVAVRRSPLDGEDESDPTELRLTAAQAEVLQVVKSGLTGEGPGKILLHGVTGSGKTEVYLQAIKEVLAAGKESIVMVPEIALTPQMIERFASRFPGKVAVLHSRLSPGERYDEWMRAAAGEAPVVIGARSAVFAPLRKLGLLILDEEHESTYKQEENPRYHARDVAIWRAEWHGATVMLGSATPSLESYWKSVQGEYRLCSLTQRIEERPMPPVDIVDMRLEIKDGHRSMFSRSLLSGLDETLAAGRQAILFLNRRGYATFVLCRSCGHVMRCPSCQVSLTYHFADAKLLCHYCDHREGYPLICPACSGRYIKHFGTGTQKVTEEVNKYFPEARVDRLDTDTTAGKGAHRRILSAFRRGESNVLVGTQMVAKGLDFPNVTLVGVISADTALNLPDFRAGERTFQLLTQVSGRAGRSDAGGRVVVQTYAPGHYAVQAARTHDYLSFYEHEIKSREELGYPPFKMLVRLLVTGKEEEKVIAAAEEMCALLAERTEVLGPSPCPISKLRGSFRWQMVARDYRLEPLLSAVRDAEAQFRRGPLCTGVRLGIDVEPQNLL